MRTRGKGQGVIQASEDQREGRGGVNWKHSVCCCWKIPGRGRGRVVFTSAKVAPTAEGGEERTKIHQLSNKSYRPNEKKGIKKEGDLNYSSLTEENRQK